MTIAALEELQIYNGHRPITYYSNEADIYADFKLKQWLVQKYFSDVWVQIVYSAEVNENKELRRQWQESHTLCQAAEVEKDKLSELVQLLQQRYATIQYLTPRTLMLTTVNIL